MKIIPRYLEKKVIDLLKFFPVVYVNGPRQAGKTTLACELISNKFKGRFITFDDAMERSIAIRNPQSFLREAGCPLIIDEVQMVPDLFRILKLIVDEKRLGALQKDENVYGCYLLTGSANFMVIPKLADAMVGRMATVTLLPFSASEYWSGKGNFIERCFAKDFTDLKKDKKTVYEAMRIATFPELTIIPKKSISEWFHSYTNKITLDDPKYVYNLEKAEYMPVLLQALATRVGNLVNDSDLSRDVGINTVTARTYRGLLSGSFIYYYLCPWYRNINKRLVKAGKAYFYDTMLLSYLLRTPIKDMQKIMPQYFGHILENFVLSELLKLNIHMDRDINISFYRTRDGREVDFVLEDFNKIVGIEVKNAEKITEKDLSGLKELQAATGNDFVCGIVLCNTQRVLQYSKDIYLVPLSALWQ